MRRILARVLPAVLLTGFLSAPASGADQDLKVVVPGIYAYPGIPEGTSQVLTDLLLEALLSRHGIRALGPSDVRAVLTAEQQKSLLACSDESCMAELAGALGADWLVAGSVGKLEDLYVITLQIIEARAARVTSRSKLTMDSLKLAPEKMGEAVDRLLGSRPRVRRPAVLANPARGKKGEVMSRRKFCKQIKAYQEALARGPYDAARVQERRRLLEDLVRTPFQRQFDQKLSCFWDRAGWYDGRLRRQLKGAAHALAARDARRRWAEYLAMYDQVKTLKEAYQRGLEMEKNGTGNRLYELPFPVRPAPVPEPDDSPAVRAFRRAYEDGREQLALALEAARRGDKQAFLALFVPRDPERGRTSPAYVFDNLTSSLKNGYRLETCPQAILSADDVERYARRLQEKEELEACWRRFKDDFVGTDTVFMKKHQGRWLIDRW